MSATRLLQAEGPPGHRSCDIQILDNSVMSNHFRECIVSLLNADTWTAKIFADGWSGGSGGTAPVIEPATGDRLGVIGLADAEDARKAATRAAAAQAQWAARPPGERAAVLRRAGALWEAHAEEIQDWIVRESGAIRPKAELETHIAAQECYEAAALPSHPHGTVLPSDEARWSFARRRPAGVVSVIAPFNFPVILSIRSVAPALALGNAVLLKPDPRTAVCGGVALVRIFEEAGLPEGLLQLLPAAPTWARPWSPLPRSVSSPSPDPRRRAAGSESWVPAISSARTWNSAATTPSSCCPARTWRWPPPPAPSAPSCTRARYACPPAAT